jgi:hypothetical protein
LRKLKKVIKVKYQCQAEAVEETDESDPREVPLRLKETVSSDCNLL